MNPSSDLATTTRRLLKPPKLSLVAALAIAICMAIVIVAVAYSMYWNDPNRKYDLARGGEKINQALSVDDEMADTTSSVTPHAAEQKIEFLDKELKALTSISSFKPDDLNDQSIQLLPAEQPSL